MFDALIASAALMMPTETTSREWNVSHPSTSVSVLREATTWPKRWRPWAACVLDRESGATLDRPQSGVGARNPSSSAAGRWQMLSPWHHGGPYMAADRLKRYGATKAQARKVREWMHDHPITRWPGLYQDLVAIEAVDRGGWRHWTGHTCNALVP